MDLMLARVGLIRGRVLGPDGNGLADAKVALAGRLLPDEAFRRSFGWTDEQVDEHWHPWVGKRSAKKSEG